MDKVGLSHILSYYASVLSSAPVQGPPSQPHIGQSRPPPVVLGCNPGPAIRQGLSVCSHFVLPDTLKWMLLFSPLCRYGHAGQRCEGIHLGSHSKTKSGCGAPKLFLGGGAITAWQPEDACPAIGLLCDLVGVGTRDSSQHRGGPACPPTPQFCHTPSTRPDSRIW